MTEQEMLCFMYKCLRKKKTSTTHLNSGAMLELKGDKLGGSDNMDQIFAHYPGLIWPTFAKMQSLPLHKEGSRITKSCTHYKATKGYQNIKHTHTEKNNTS